MPREDDNPGAGGGGGEPVEEVLHYELGSGRLGLVSVCEVDRCGRV